MQFATEISEIKKLGFSVDQDASMITIKKGVQTIVFWKKKQWYSGKGVEDGRGIKNLIEQLKKQPDTFEDFYTNNPEAYSHLIGIFQKHTQIRLTENQKKSIIAETKARFDVILKH